MMKKTQMNSADRLPDPICRVGFYGSESPDYTPAAAGLPHGLCVITTVIFIGVILSLAVYFGIPAWMGIADMCDDYYDGTAHSDIAFPEFSDAFYLSRELREKIVRHDYVLFGNLSCDSVILGKNGFVFDIAERGGEGDADGRAYSYIGDYIGAGADDADSATESAALSDAVTRLRSSYAAKGIYCLVAVIPNLQTVYGEMMPDYFGEISPNTRLTRLTSYMKRNCVDGLLDLTQTMLTEKEHGQLYNNTEDSLNALGAYYAYLAVLDALPEEYTSRTTPVKINNTELIYHLTDGKELARRAGLSALIRNRTVSLSTGFTQMYTSLDRLARVQVTYALDKYKDFLPDDPVLLLEFTSDWDRILMADYFSNTYGRVGYHTGIVPDNAVTSAVDSDVTVVFIHEYELDSLLDCIK